MKKRSAVILIAAIMLLNLSACGSTKAQTEYRTIASIKLAVDTAMNIWADRVVAGKTTPAQENQVRAAFTAYTTAAGTAAAIMRSTADAPPPDLTAAAGALLNLLSTFGVKVGGK